MPSVGRYQDGTKKPYVAVNTSSPPSFAEGIVIIDPISGEPLNSSEPGQVISPPDEVFVGTLAATGTVIKQDVSGWNTFIAEFSATAGSHSIVIEGNATGLDGDQWYALSGQPVDTASNSVIATRPVTTGYSAFIYSKRFSFIRARITAYGGSGTISVRLTLTNSPTFNGPYQLNLASNVNNNGAAQPSPYGVLIAGVSRESNVIDDMGAAVYVTPTYAKGGQQVTLPYSVHPAQWQYAAASGGINNSTTAVVAKTASGATQRNFVTSLTLSADALSAATDFLVLEGTNVIFRVRIGTAGLPVTNIVFNTPLKSALNAAINIQLGSAVTGGVYANLQGYFSQ